MGPALKPDHLDLIAFGGQRNFTPAQAQRVFAERFQPPAVQRVKITLPRRDGIKIGG